MMLMVRRQLHLWKQLSGCQVVRAANNSLLMMLTQGQRTYSNQRQRKTGSLEERMLEYKLVCFWENFSGKEEWRRGGGGKTIERMGTKSSKEVTEFDSPAAHTRLHLSLPSFSCSRETTCKDFKQKWKLVWLVSWTPCFIISIISWYKDATQIASSQCHSLMSHFYDVKIRNNVKQEVIEKRKNITRKQDLCIQNNILKTQTIRNQLTIKWLNTFFQKRKL